MNDIPRQQRRSPLVVILDAMLSLAALAHAVPTPRERVAGSAGRSRAAGRLLLVAGALAAVGGTVLLIVFLVRMPAGPALVPDPAAMPAVAPSQSVGPSAAKSPGASRSGPVAPPGSPSPPGRSRTGPPATSPSPDRGAVGVPLTARYTAAAYAVGLLGYRATITVTNPGATVRDGWLATVTLPRPSLVVSAVSGATAVQNGRTWTFTPDGTTARIPPGGSVQIGYEVHGATLVDAAPDDCRVDDRRCTGISAG
jgi:Cellulose binding domain